MSTKYVIVEQINYGRSYRAKPGLSFATYDEGEAWIFTKVNEKYRYRYRVESRKVKDVDASQIMHCQCCGRAIHAALGTIAHHGYQRPGDGWQTASCWGAKRLPWEVDRTVVGEVIAHLRTVLERSIEGRAEALAETISVTHRYQVYDRNVRGGYIHKSIELTRDTFADILKANPDGIFTHSFDNTFDKFKKRDLENRDRKIEQLKRDIKEFTARYEGWTQTYKRDGDQWVAL
jgi:hypothetical protein